jgi:hypothetical protein
MIRSQPVFTYLKSRGFYAGVQVDGTVILERTDENEKFYGERIGVADILAGKAKHPPRAIKLLMETVKSAEGRSDVDRKMLAEIEGQPAPGDLNLDSPGGHSAPPTFGIPEPDDPDPFGVLALEKEGFEIREAGSKSRPPSTQFEYHPSPTSPIYNRFHRRSMDTLATRSNRESYMSTRSSRTRTSTDRVAQTAEMGTQTDDFITPSTSPSLNEENKRIVEEDEESFIVEPEEIDYTKIDLGPIRHLTNSDDLDGTTINDSPRAPSEDEHRQGSIDTNFTSDDEDGEEGEVEGECEEEEEEEEEEEAVIFEAASAQATIITPQAIKARGGLVNIPKRPPPPPLPPRNLLRASRSPVKMVDAASGSPPPTSSTDGFEDAPVHATDKENVDVAELVESPVVIEDAGAKTPVPTTPNLLEEKLEAVVAEQLLDEITPATIAPEETKLATSSNDEDSFHSLPTTPIIEQAAELKVK